MLIDNIMGEYDVIDNTLVEVFGELSDLKLSLSNNQRVDNSLAKIEER